MAAPIDRIVGPVDSRIAREWTSANRRISCAYCGRDRFCKPQPHICNCGGLRKRNLLWYLLDEKQIAKRIIPTFGVVR